MRTLHGYFMIVCCINFWLFMKEYCTHEYYFDIIDRLICRQVNHAIQRLTIFFVNKNFLVESLVEEQPRGSNSEAMHCSHYKFEINKFYRFLILSTFLWFHICVILLDRNFSIIAHVNHGKSTLVNKLLERTGTIKRGHGQPQYLEKL